MLINQFGLNNWIVMDVKNMQNGTILSTVAFYLQVWHLYFSYLLHLECFCALWASF